MSYLTRLTYANGSFPGLQTECQKLNGRRKWKGKEKRKKQIRGGKSKVYAPIAEEDAVSGVVDVNNVVEVEMLIYIQKV